VSNPLSLSLLLVLQASFQELEEAKSAHAQRVRLDADLLQQRMEAVERTAQTTRAALDSERASLRAERQQAEALSRSAARATGEAEQSLVVQREALLKCVVVP